MNFDYPKELRTLIVDNVERRYVTHRCPRDVTSFLNTIYKAAVATTSPVVHSVKARKKKQLPRSPPRPTATSVTRPKRLSKTILRLRQKRSSPITSSLVCSTSIGKS